MKPLSDLGRVCGSASRRPRKQDVPLTILSFAIVRARMDNFRPFCLGSSREPITKQDAPANHFRQERQPFVIHRLLGHFALENDR